MDRQAKNNSAPTTFIGGALMSQEMSENFHLIAGCFGIVLPFVQNQIHQDAENVFYSGCCLLM